MDTQSWGPIDFIIQDKNTTKYKRKSTLSSMWGVELGVCDDFECICVAQKALILFKTDIQNYGLVMSHHFSQGCF